MQFSTTLQQNVKEEIWWQKFVAQPHQLFFTSALFFSILIMGLTLFSLLGFTTVDFTLIHGFGLTYALFTNAFLGFLITVIPKYNASLIIEKNKYLAPWIIYQFAVFTTLFINSFIGKIAVSLTLFYFVKIFYDTIKKGKAVIKIDSIYINSVLALGSALLLIETVTSSNLSILIFFAYLISMVYIIALKMVPAFYFAYTRVTPWNKPKYITFVSVILITTTGIAMQFHFDEALKIISFISSLFFGFVLIKLNLFRKVPAILFILALGFFWFEIGFISLFVESLFLDYTLKLSFHIFAIGFITTLLLGFGSRVIMGHAIPAEPIIADNITKLLFIFTQIVLILRILASVFFVVQKPFNLFLYASSSLWILMFVLWILRYGKTLLRIK